MGIQSIITGYINIWGKQYAEQTRQTIANYPFDEGYPFTNIFWCDSPAQYFGPVVGLFGSYKQIEEDWSEWLWKFSQFLSTLEAMDAVVRLDSVIGQHRWRLFPKSFYLERPTPEAGTLIGEQWGIVEAPEDDFSIKPEWLARTGRHWRLDEETGEVRPVQWDKFVERWPPIRWDAPAPGTTDTERD